MNYPTLEAHSAQLKADVSAEALKQALTMPVEEKIRDIKINCTQMEEDADAFARFNIDWNSIATKLMTATEVLREAEAAFTNYSTMTQSARDIWRENKDSIYAWRSESLARLNHLLYVTGDEDLKRSLTRISEGSGHLDAIEDVYQIFGLVDAHFESLSTYNLTQERVDEARAVFSLVDEAYPRTLNTEAGLKAAKEMRDRAFWYLVSLEKDLKEGFLPLVFHDNFDRRREYSSNYRNSHR